MRPRWKALAGLIALGMFIFVPLAWAATDAFFAGRSLRMTKITAGKCTDSAYRCIWFDITTRFRFWNGTADDYVVTTASVPDGGVPPKGRILCSDGTEWESLPAGTAGQVLTYRPTDMGGPCGVAWETP
jgi:hypothetical protein